jgi:hypothetical protein
MKEVAKKCFALRTLGLQISWFVSMTCSAVYRVYDDFQTPNTKYVFLLSQL